MYAIDVNAQTNVISAITTTAYNDVTSGNWNPQRFTESNDLAQFGQFTATQVDGTLSAQWAFNTGITFTGQEVTTFISEDGTLWAQYDVTDGQSVNTIYMVNTMGGLSTNTVSCSFDCACTVQLTSS